MVYSGGNLVDTVPGGGSTQAYYTQSDGNWGDGGYQQITGSTGTVTEKASGQITATFTWNPDHSDPGEPPPTVVIVQETSSVNWSVSGNNYTGVTGGCQHGLTSDTVDITATTSTSTSGTQAATGYSVKNNPGATFTVTASPQANAGGSCQPHFSVANASAGATYTAAAAPVQIVLSGGIGTQESHQYLIGQLVTAGLCVPFGLKATSWDWVASGGNPFQDWLGKDGSGTLTALTAGTTDTYNYHYKTPTSPTTISCQAFIAAPAGSSPANGFNVMPTRNPAGVPPSAFAFDTYTAQNAGSFPGPGTINVAGVPANGVGLYYPPNVSWLAFYGLTDPPTYNNDIGILYRGSVTTSTANPNPWGTGGGWNYVQLVTANRHLTTTDNVYHTNNANGTQYLDTTYPYEPSPYDPDNGSPGTYPDDGSANIAADGPAMGLAGANELGAADTFQTRTMYRPPGTGSEFVPLNEVDWYWNGEATFDGGVWTLKSSGSGWTLDADYPAFPLWTGNINNVGGNWTPPIP